jgi:outer membrane protein assembly factor BamB
MHRFALALVAIAHAPLVCSADWMQFRGTHNNSLALDARLPITWSASKNVSWKVELPGRGPSSPIVVGNKVIVTRSSGVRQDRLHAICVDARSGNVLWHRQMWANGRTMCHPFSANAAPTPASDGERVFAFYSSTDLVCYDLDGDLQWYRGLGYDYPKAGNDVGMSSSPVVAANTVAVQVEAQGDAFVAGIDAETGETRWRLERHPAPNWSSPAVVKDADGRNLVLLTSSEGLIAIDIVSGTEIWSYKTNAGVISSVLASGLTAFVPGGGLTALDISHQEPRRLWQSSRVRADNTCPIVHDGQVFALGGNVLTCASADSGDVKWKLRLTGDFWATPVLANGHLYCINAEGVAQAGTSEFGEKVLGSPAVSDNALYVHGDKHLWKIAEP